MQPKPSLGKIGRSALLIVLIVDSQNNMKRLLNF